MTQRFSRSGEEGTILILMVFISAVLLAIVGLALDTGTLYRGQLWLQKAADAGALSGVGATVYQSDSLPTNPSDMKRFIEVRAEQLAYVNLRRAGLEIPRSNISADFSIDSSTGPGLPRLTVSAKADIPLYLLNKVPAGLFGTTGIDDTKQLSATAVTQRRNANIVLVLDISSSMQCPAVGSCDCLTAKRKQPDGSILTCAAEAQRNGTVSKSAALVSAVRDFVARFDPQRDRISLVVFNTTAKVAVPFRTVDAITSKADFGFNRTDDEFDRGPGIISTLAGFQNGGNTNVCDGFMRAYEAVQNAGLVDRSGHAKEDVAYIYFSDGAPTAGRFLLTPGAGSKLPVHDPLGYGGGSGRDYIHYSTQWIDPASGRNYPGPSPFVPTGSVAFSDQPALFPPPASAAACSENPPPSNESKYPAYFAGCAASMESHLPQQPQNRYGADFTSDRLAGAILSSEPSAPYYRGWQEMYYYCAIEMADFLREKRGVVFSLGWGESSADPNALQNPNDGFSLKRYFMSRVANDYLLAVDSRDRQQLPRFPEPQYTNYSPYEQSRKSPQGDYIEAPSGSAGLQSMFSRVAAQILLRLVA